ncbi:MAG TPA: hypothetical protein VEI49_10775 [Terriglobales bacterium]|nr:hypothetical protein [Terriglobales bacterium]
MRRRNLAFAIAVLVLGLPAFAQEAVPIAVVVSLENPIKDISLPILRDFFRCEKLYWQTGKRVVVFTRPKGSPEHQVMLHSLYSMNEEDYQKLWVMKQIRGDVSCRVTELPSRGILQEGLRTYPGAIALVRVLEVTPQMKIITVNGKHVRDADYPLQ